jgi:hypothetical protein
MKFFRIPLLLCSLALCPLAQAESTNMEKALKNLTQVRQDLERANPDKGGHRVKAIALVDQAIAEVQQGMAYDHAHQGER